MGCGAGRGDLAIRFAPGVGHFSVWVGRYAARPLSGGATAARSATVGGDERADGGPPVIIERLWAAAWRRLKGSAGLSIYMYIHALRT
jgi:hypothetical protein